MRAPLYVAILFCVLLLAGCLGFSLARNVNIDANVSNVSVIINLPPSNVTFDPNISINGSLANSTLNLSKRLPGQLTYCIFGLPDARYNQAIEQNFTFNGDVVPLGVAYKNSTDYDVSNCATIILKDDGGNIYGGRYVDTSARNAILVQARKGTHVIVSQQAATRVHDDAATFGWDFILSPLVPARIDNIGQSWEPVVSNASGTYFFKQQLFPGMKNFKVATLELVEVTPVDGDGKISASYGPVMATIRTGEFESSASYFALLGRKNKGIVNDYYSFYFAYDPLRVQNVFKAVIELTAEDSLARWA